MCSKRSFEGNVELRPITAKAGKEIQHSAGIHGVHQSRTSKSKRGSPLVLSCLCLTALFAQLLLKHLTLKYQAFWGLSD